MDGRDPKRRRTTTAAAAEEEESPSEHSKEDIRSSRNNLKGDTNPIHNDLSSKRFCANLQASIDRWDLVPPYASIDDNELWGSYYAERSILEFRHSNFFKEDGEELECIKLCYEPYGSCGWGSSIVDNDGIKRCTHCNGTKDFYRFVKPTDDLSKAWREELHKDKVLKAILATRNNGKLPFLHPLSMESRPKDKPFFYGTTKEHYNDLLSRIRDRVKATVASTAMSTSLSSIARRVASGVYILHYWARFNESETEVRVAEIVTRFYSPVGQGHSVDLCWRHTYELPESDDAPNFSVLRAVPRKLKDSNALQPMKCLGLREMGQSYNLASLESCTHFGGVKKVISYPPKNHGAQISYFWAKWFKANFLAQDDCIIGSCGRCSCFWEGGRVALRCNAQEL